MTDSSKRLFLRQICVLLGSGLYGCGGGTSTSTGTSPAPAVSIAGAVFIQMHPADQTVVSGNTATFQVVASGSVPLRYQWQRDGMDIPGATQAVYVLGSATTADDSAMFSVSISNQMGSVTSRTATLNVTLAGTTIDTTAVKIDTTLMTIDEV